MEQNNRDEYPPFIKEFLSSLPKGKLFMTTKEVSVMTGIPVGSLQNMRFYGSGPKYLKLETRVRYLIDDILDYMLKNKVVPVSVA